MARPDQTTVAPNEVIYCVNHPDRETRIRCSKCLDPICTKCAVHTPVGFRCKKCAIGTRPNLYVISSTDYVVALAVGLAAAVIAGALVAQVGLLWTFFVAAPAGGLVAEAVLRSTRGKRGRGIQIITGFSIAAGALVGPLIWVAISSGSWQVLLGNPLALLGALLNIKSLLYAVLAIGAAMARLR